MVIKVFRFIRERWNSLLDVFDVRGATQENMINLRMANQLNLVTAAGCVVFGILYGFFGFHFQAVMLAFGFFVFVGLAWFNSRSESGVGRLLYSVLSNSFLFLLADSFGREAGVQWCFFAGACLSYIVYSQNEKKQRLLATSLPVLCYFLLEITSYDLLVQASVAPDIQQVISQVVIPFVFLSLILALSQRHKANDEIAEVLQSDRDLSELRFSTVSENAPIMISSFDSQGLPILWNKACREKTGYSLQEIQAQPELLPALFGGSAGQYKNEMPFQNADGRFREYLACTKGQEPAVHMWANFKLPDNKIISVGYDITDLKQAREELKKANEDLEVKVAMRTAQLEETTNTLVQMGSEIDEVFWIRNGQDFEFQYVSPGSQKVWGLAPEELMKSADCMLEIIHEEEVSFYEEKWRSLLKPPYGKTEMEYRIIKGNDVRWVWSRCFPIQTPQGELSQIYGVTIDITERKRTQEVLEQQRIQMISSARLAALGEMSGGIAHEVNNPLAIIQLRANQIRSMMDLVSEDVKFGKINEHAAKIEQTVDRIAKIVRSLRQFARDGGQDPFVPASLKSILEDTLELCREKILNQDVRLEVANLQEDWMLDCRSTQLAQVFLNLLMNSLDAVASQTEKWIQVQVQDKGEEFIISIKDSGAGIPEAIREKIMLPFFTTKEVGQGTGLGLSISKGIIETHHGSLRLDESSVNTCFQVILPKCRENKRVSSKIGA